MILSSYPIITVDVVGSICMVIIALFTFYKAKILRENHQDNAVFLYLLWISTGLAVFALSRSFGHILRQFLILSGNGDIWHDISSYSGSVNTVSFMLVGLITLFFNQIWNINEKILSGKAEIEDAHAKLTNMNQTLEQMVVERTERLTSSEHKCRRIFEQSLDTIILTDHNFKVIEINPAGHELTGYSRDEIIFSKMDIGSFFAEQDDWNEISGKFTQTDFILNEETYFLRPNGEVLTVMITGGVDYGAFGCAKTFHFIIKNVNEKKQLERQIAQADKLAALGELSACVAHEINNPLGMALGYTQLLLKNNSKDFEDLKLIEKHVKNCKNIVSDLLAFSRKGSATMNILDMNDVVSSVFKFLNNHPDFRDIRIDFRKSEEDLKVKGNEQELVQVFINLMINACHAMDKKGNITIETSKTVEGRILISIEDNGKGIPEKDLPKIFDPFFTTKPVGEGTGLGLSVGYGIVKRHNGKIRVKSKEGVGTTFTINLPSSDTLSN